MIQGKGLLFSIDEFESEHSIVVSSVDKNFPALVIWMERCYNRLIDKVDSKSTSPDEQD